MELYPFFDGVWTGEASDYDGTPDHFVVAIAGAPFGLPAQMLSGAVNKRPGLYYRGLLFGMTERAGWANAVKSLDRASALWRLFDAVGADRSTLFGFWRDNPSTRVVLSSPCDDLRHTVFERPGLGALVVVASWSSARCSVRVDAAALLGVRTPRWLEPRIPHLQCGAPGTSGRARTFDVAPRGGVLAVVFGDGAAEALGPLEPRGECAPAAPKTLPGRSPTRSSARHCGVDALADRGRPSPRRRRARRLWGSARRRAAAALVEGEMSVAA